MDEPNPQESKSYSNINECRIISFESIFMTPSPNPKLYSAKTFQQLNLRSAVPNPNPYNSPSDLSKKFKTQFLDTCLEWYGQPEFWKGLRNRADNEIWTVDVTWDYLRISGFKEFIRFDVLQSFIDMEPEDHDNIVILVICDRPEDKFADIVDEVFTTILKFYNINNDSLISKSVIFKPSMETSVADFRCQLVRPLLAKKNWDLKRIKFYDHPELINDYQNDICGLIEQNEHHCLPQYIEVVQPLILLSPFIERRILEKIILDHNSTLTEGMNETKLKRSFLATGYVLSDASQNLIMSEFGRLCDIFASSTSNFNYYDSTMINAQPAGKFMPKFDHILISNGMASEKQLFEMGGLNSEFIWEMVAIGSISQMAFIGLLKPKRFVNCTENNNPNFIAPFKTMFTTPILIISCLPNFIIKPKIPEKIKNWTNIQPIEISTTLQFIEAFSLSRPQKKPIMPK